MKSGRSSRDKGIRFERKVVSDIIRVHNVQVVRTPLSGGWGRMKTKGDVVSDGDEWPFFVECKNQEGWNLDQLMEGRGPVEDWWLKTVVQAEEESKFPMLVFTRNRRPVYVRLPSEFTDDCRFSAINVIRLNDGSIVSLWDEILPILKVKKQEV